MPERVAQVGLAAIGWQLAYIKDLWSTRGTDRRSYGKLDRAPPPAEIPLDPETWCTLLGSAVSGLTPPAIKETLARWWRSAEPALDLYRMLVGEGRASAVAAAAPFTIRLLLRRHGSANTRRVLAEFWRHAPQGYTAAEEARAFLRFLSATGPALPGLTEATAQDAALLAVSQR